MTHLTVMRLKERLVIVGRAPLSVRPFRQNSEEARDILGNLPGVLATYIATEARTPQPARLFDKIVGCG
jgi:hypothetical protein